MRWFATFACLLALISTSTAEPLLRQSSGSEVIQIDDNDSLDEIPLDGVLAHNGSVGDFAVNLTGGASSPPLAPK